jgi:hypothetical protein
LGKRTPNPQHLQAYALPAQANPDFLLTEAKAAIHHCQQFMGFDS